MSSSDGYDVRSVRHLGQERQFKVTTQVKMLSTECLPLAATRTTWATWVARWVLGFLIPYLVQGC